MHHLVCLVERKLNNKATVMCKNSSAEHPVVAALRLNVDDYISVYDTDELLFVHWQLPFDDEHVPTLFRKIKCESLQWNSF